MRLFGETRGDDIVEIRGDGRIGVRGRERSRGKNAVADRGDGITIKGIQTGQHFVEDDAEREEIRASVLSATENLFRAPIGGSAADRRISALMAGQPRHTEVRELDAIFEGDENVCGLNVSMDDGAAMRDRKCNSNVGSPFASSGIRNAALGNDFIEGLALDQFHNQVRSLRGLLDAHVVNGDDGGMRKLANDAGFAKKTVAGVTACERGGEELDRDGAVNQGIMGADDAAVCACADSFEDLVATDLQG